MYLLLFACYRNCHGTRSKTQRALANSVHTQNDCPVPNQRKNELRHASLAGHVPGEKSARARGGSKKRGSGRRRAEEPPSKVNVASLLQRALDVKAEQMGAGPLASDGSPKSSTPETETPQSYPGATGVTCQKGEALPSVPTPSTAAPESPTSEEDKSLPSAKGALFQGCGPGTDPASQPSTLPSAGGSVAEVPMVKETEEDPWRSSRELFLRADPCLAHTNVGRKRVNLHLVGVVLGRRAVGWAGSSPKEP